MPLLQYVCKKCGKNFEELVKKHDDPVLCLSLKHNTHKTRPMHKSND
ncbi:MAG: hypothetical protein K2L12_02560 [Clostridia bacterium]|nr:hypothetical protein [Clostridia bacterium]